MSVALPAPACPSDPKLGAAAERALAKLRDGLADKLEWLLDAVECPAGAEATIRSWLALIRSEDLTAALAPDALETVLRSLSVAYLDRFAYTGSRPQRWRLGEPVDLELTDRGGAIVILAVRNAAAELGRGRLGREGAALLRRVHDAEQEQIRSIAVAIGRVL
jgi:hypothetical protein